MRRTRRFAKYAVAACTLVLMVAANGLTAQDARPAPGPEQAAGGRAVDLVLCLDTSGSMSGLIDAARQKLWSMVNLLALAEPSPTLRVALLTYGHDGHDPARGWVRVDAPLTDDLDEISGRLFALTTNGGTEYVGRVVRTALEELDWDPSEDALRVILVAGNESADQDPDVATREIAGQAIGRGILVNAIYCGDPADGIAAGWQKVARAADGHFAAIDHQNGTVVVSTPFDAELSSLSEAVNATYIPIGSAGRDGLANQTAQDSNAAGMNEATAASRAVTKGGKLYVKSWDLVDGVRNGTVRWDELDPEELPPEMRPMSEDDRKAYVAEKASRRSEIQERIQDLQVQRQAFIQEETKNGTHDDQNSFEHATAAAIRSQAEDKGFRFDEQAAPPDRPED